MSRKDNGPVAVFFDLDDTLYDQLAPFREAALATLGEEALRPLPISGLYLTFRRYSDMLWEPYSRGELPLDEMRVRRLQLTFADFGVPLSVAQAARLQDAYLEEQGRIRFFPGVKAVFAELERRGCLIGIITNGPEEHQQRKITALALERLVPRERIFISGAVGLRKPDPALFRHVNEATGTAPGRSCYVGDSWDNDVVGARAAEWGAVVWFNYRRYAPREGRLPDLIVSDYTELTPLMMKAIDGIGAEA